MIWPNDNAGIVLMVLKTEGGYVNNPSDKGGPTNYGVTIDTLASYRKSQVTAADIQALTLTEAAALYLNKFVIVPNFDQLVDIKLRAAMVDFGVLFGPIRAIQALQMLMKVNVDGLLGPQSLATANTILDTRPIINQLSVIRVNKHTDRVMYDASQLQFFRGWVARALSFIE